MALANPIKGDVPFEAGGKALVLNFSVNALCALEDKLQLTVEQIGRLFGAQMSLNHVRTCVWAALQEHHPEMTPVDAGLVMNDLGPKASTQLIFQAFAAAFPDAVRAGEGEGDGADPQTAAGTGSSSTAAG